jgi:hypothetical protein
VASAVSATFVVERSREAVSVARNQYEICVQGVLDEHWSDWFDGFRLQRNEAADTTVLVGVVADQANLHAVLSRIFDLGLPLLNVRIVDQD